MLRLPRLHDGDGTTSAGLRISDFDIRGFGISPFVIRISSRRALAPSQRVGFRPSDFGFGVGWTLAIESMKSRIPGDG